MMARNRHYGRNRTAALKTRAGIATAVVLGSGAIAGVAMAAGSHSAGIAAAPAAHTARFGNEGTMLATALGDWNSSRQGTYSQLAQMTTMRGFSQTSHNGKTLDIQRGIVVLATKQFIILQSANGSAAPVAGLGRDEVPERIEHDGGHGGADREHLRDAAGHAVGQHGPGDHAAGREPDHRRGHADAEPRRRRRSPSRWPTPT